MTRLGRSTLLLNSKAPQQMTAECWRWRPRWNRLSIASIYTNRKDMMFGLKITADFCSQLDNLNCCKKDSTVHVHVLTKGCFCFVQNGSANMDMAFQCIETDCNLLVYSSRVKLTQLMCPSKVKRGRMVTSRRVVCRRTAAMNLLRGRNAVHFRNKTFSND